MFNVRRISCCSGELCLYRICCSDELCSVCFVSLGAVASCAYIVSVAVTSCFYACHMCNYSDEVFLISVVSVVTVASSEESPVAMKLKKMWLKAPVPEDGDTNLGKF